MNPLKTTASVLAQIACWRPDRIIDKLAEKYEIHFRTRTIRAVDSTTIKLMAFNFVWAQH